MTLGFIILEWLNGRALHCNLAVGSVNFILETIDQGAVLGLSPLPQSGFYNKLATGVNLFLIR